MVETPTLKQVFWIASSRDDLRAFPQAVRRELGRAIRIATPKHVVDLVKSRLRAAERDHYERSGTT